MNNLYLDTETFSPTPIKRGVYRYAQDAELMLVAYALDDGEVQLWDRTVSVQLPADLAAYLRDVSVMRVAHNAMFDRIILREVGAKGSAARWHCTMAQAMAHSLPGGLDKLCQALKIPLESAKGDGKALIRLFCMPQPKGYTLRRATRLTHPDEWRQFCEYAKQDIVAMRQVHKRLPTWNYSGAEKALWVLDQQINDRGVAVDVELATAALKTVGRSKALMQAIITDKTDGDVTSATQRDKLLAHICVMHGVSLPDLTASTVERRLDDPELPEVVKDLLRTRLQVSSTSVSKYKTLLDIVCADGRMRGLLQFCGALRTARWAGRLFQPQNLSRIPKYLHKGYDAAIDMIKADDGELESTYDNPIEVCGAVVRGGIIAPKGKKLVIADLSNIEGRALAWLAGEQWKLDAFAAFDDEPDNMARDLYVIGYARSFGFSIPTVIEDYKAGGTMRLIGKVQELALGYQGAVGAFTSMAEVYGVQLSEEQALAIVKAWRKANPAIVAFWYALERAVIAAIRSPGNEQSVKALRIRFSANWLRILLPSGRSLCYPFAQVEANKVSYMGVNTYTRRWDRISTYGGKLTENVTQAVARDILARNLPEIERRGYSITMLVHDEVVAEVPETEQHTSTELAALMSTVPAWAEGLPLAAKGYETHRYRKD